MSKIGEQRKCPKCGSDFLEWEGEIYSPFWVDEFKEECPECGYFRQSILGYGLTQPELSCMHFSDSNIGLIHSGIVEKPPELKGKFVMMVLHAWSLPALEIRWYRPEEISTDLTPLHTTAAKGMTREEHQMRYSAEKEIREHAIYCKEVRKLTQEDLAEISKRGVVITDDPTADLMAYVAKKEEREKAASSESDSNDTGDLDTDASEIPSMPKDLLERLVRLANKIARPK